MGASHCADLKAGRETGSTSSLEFQTGPKPTVWSSDPRQAGAAGHGIHGDGQRAEPGGAA